MNKFDLTGILTTLVQFARPFLPLGADAAHSTTQRWATIPAKQREKLLAGMSAEDKATGEELFERFADSASDLTVFLASRGVIEPD